MRTHVPVERLLAFADSDESILTMEEFGHLKACAECFTTWIEFIRLMVRFSLLADRVTKGAESNFGLETHSV